ncbi:hypothetical protein K525DRAFT_270876 [Schizophyllum commune Loenen D]|nr:hypothetical protein K525DRAFT_270876 [Schizophyllum commune Loenen D]
MDSRRSRQYGRLTPAIVLGYLFALSTRYNRRLTEYSSYLLWTTILLDLTEFGKEGLDAHLAVAPQPELFASSSDAEPSDPSKSEATRPEGGAKTVHPDLAILSHGITINWNASQLASAALVSLKTVWHRICSPNEVTYDPTLLKTIRMESSYVLFVELKRPVSRHIPIHRWLRHLIQTLNKAKVQVEEQFDVAMQSDRYIGKHGVWLIAGSADAFCLRWARCERVDKEYLDHAPTRGAFAAACDARAASSPPAQKKKVILTAEQRDARAVRAASRRAMATQPTNTLAHLRSLTPPFSDQEIADYFTHVPGDEEMSFAPVPPEGLNKERISAWTKPIRIGSLAAARYLDIVRQDIRAMAVNQQKKRESNKEKHNPHMSA